MTRKLTKIKSGEWLGNGLGTTSATYCVSGTSIRVEQLGGGRWFVFDDSITHISRETGLLRSKFIARAETFRDARKSALKYATELYG